MNKYIIDNLVPNDDDNDDDDDDDNNNNKNIFSLML
jgi:hypothetical protein